MSRYPTRSQRAPAACRGPSATDPGRHSAHQASVFPLRRWVPPRRSLRFHSLFSSPRGLHLTHSVFPSLLETNFPRCRWPSEPELTVALTLWAPRRDGSSILFGIVYRPFIPCDKRSLLPAFLGLDLIALFLSRKGIHDKGAVASLSLILAYVYC